MKKILLSVTMALLATIGSAQVICFVDPPSANTGNYEFTYASTGWSCPDMLNPLNAVHQPMAFASDGTASDSLGCGAITNGPAINGKIAVVYRGTCQYSTKALNCQNAGAVAVIIINNVPGSPVGLGAGTDAPSVTIPVVMISQAAGALLKSDIELGTNYAFIGSKLGYYGNDMGIYGQHVLRPKQFANLQALSQDASEFDLELGAWVINYGSNAQTNVTLNCLVELGSTNLYNQTSSPIASIPANDSVFISLPTFSQSSYANGYYRVKYEVASAAVDEFIDDNTLNADFMMSDSLYSYSRVDSITYLPIKNNYYRAANTVTENSSCLRFTDPNASRMVINGLTFSGATNVTNQPSLDGELVEIYAYIWEDAFTDLNDAMITTTTEIAFGEYNYISNLQQTNIFVPFTNQIFLEDDKNYLFCIKYYGANYFSGFDAGIDYLTNRDVYFQPMFPLSADDAWNVNGFGPDVVPAITVNMFHEVVGLVELPKSDLVAYPNPANQIVNIPLHKIDGNINVEIFDLEGRIVGAQNLVMNTSRLTVDVTTLPTGIYNLKLTYEDGTCDNVKVVVSK